jgi:glycerophosphoryl diester phosphodiesterase
MPAFQRAIDVGVDALELDIHLTRDAQLIVAHDDTAERTCGARLAWAELELADAQRLDAGWGFLAADGTRPFAGQGIRVPTFEEVLVTFPDVRVNVDLKGEHSVDVALELLGRLGAATRVTIASFQLRTMREIRKRGYGGETALAQPEIASLVSLPAVMWRQLPGTGHAAQVPTKHGPLHFDRAAFVAKCHSLGLRIDYWVIDDFAEAERLLALGADGIMTNDPATIRPLFS